MFLYPGRRQKVARTCDSSASEGGGERKVLLDNSRIHANVKDLDALAKPRIRVCRQ
jgi:hypothetical protein